jgi:hypothetical protein
MTARRLLLALSVALLLVSPQAATAERTNSPPIPCSGVSSAPAGCAQPGATGWHGLDVGREQMQSEQLWRWAVRQAGRWNHDRSARAGAGSRPGQRGLPRFGHRDHGRRTRQPGAAGRWYAVGLGRKFRGPTRNRQLREHRNPGPGDWLDLGNKTGRPGLPQPGGDSRWKSVGLGLEQAG